jgi:hypothetical protein
MCKIFVSIKRQIKRFLKEKHNELSPHTYQNGKKYKLMKHQCWQAWAVTGSSYIAGEVKWNSHSGKLFGSLKKKKQNIQLLLWLGVTRRGTKELFEMMGLWNKIQMVVTWFFAFVKTQNCTLKDNYTPINLTWKKIQLLCHPAITFLAICAWKLKIISQALVAHACNPSYSGGRDLEDQGSKPTQADSLWDPILKKPFTKKGWWVAQDVGPEFKSQ